MLSRPAYLSLSGVAVLMLAGAAIVRSQGESKPPPALRGVLGRDGEGYIPGSAEMIAGPVVSQIQPNPFGRYVLLSRTVEGLPPGSGEQGGRTGEKSLVLWDTIARRSRVVWEGPVPTATPEKQSETDIAAEWLPGTNCVVAVRTVATPNPATGDTETGEGDILFADADRDVRMHSVFHPKSESEVDLMVSPASPMAVVIEQMHETPEDAKSDHRTLHIMDSQGRFRLPPISLNAATSMRLRWTRDGKQILGGLVRLIPPPADAVPDANGKKPRPTFETKWVSINPETGVVTQIAETPPLGRTASAAKPVPPVDIFTRHLSIFDTNGKPSGAVLNSLWLQGTDGKDTALLLAPNVRAPRYAMDYSGPKLSPDNRAVLYESDHAVYAVPLFRVPGKLIGDSTREALKRKAMAQAKHIGLAMMMYAEDYDGLLPPSGDVPTTAGPYLRDLDDFNSPLTNTLGFSYMRNGDAISTLGTPGGVPIGALSGPGGQAVIFADGHVVWQDGPGR